MDDVKFLGVFFEILVVVRCSEQVSSQPKEGIVEADKDVRCMCTVHVHVQHPNRGQR